MLASEAPIRPLLQQAQRAAQCRGQRMTTLHLLWVVLQRGDRASAILDECGVRESELLRAVVANRLEEPASAVEVLIEQAARLAVARGATPESLDIVLALSTKERTAAFRWLDEHAKSLSRLRETTQATLGLGVAPAGLSLPDRTRPRVSPRLPNLVAPLRSMQPSRLATKFTRSQLLSPKPGAPATPPRPLNARPTRGAKSSPQRASKTPTDKADSVTATGAPAPLVKRGAAPARKRKLGCFELDPERFPILTSLGRNLTALAAAGAIDPVIGRDREIEQLLDVLARRRANNPVVIGPAGVGKTAVVEGLALRLAQTGKETSAAGPLLIVETSAGALVAGTGVRGAVAEKMKQLRAEIGRADGRVVLFIDEIHSVVGAGDGPDDLAHELKGALTQGDFPAIGATTEVEYRKHFERDPALARRFTPVLLREPAVEEAVRIVEGLLPRYAAHHGVVFGGETARAAVELSARYLTERVLPEKAIAMVDLAAARQRRRGGKSVDRAAIARVISEQAHVPVERMLMEDGQRLLQMEQSLAERVVGHRAVIGRIAALLRRSSAGFHGRRPLGTLLFLGPTGVGKTEMAKAIADALFPADAMTRLDMSDFSEPHSVARLMGAPPGYVGHDDGGQLTEAVRRRPYQLILLDEVEKAHRDVFLALLPLLDEGHLTDSHGRIVDFTKTVICMTSNLGAETQERSARIGFDCSADDVLALRDTAVAAARRALAPELWNRIDEPLYFAPLAREEVRTIAERLLEQVKAAVDREHGVRIVVRPSVVDTLIGAGGFEPALGARPMRRTIGRLVEGPLASLLLSGCVPRGATVELVGDGGSVKIAHDSSWLAAE